MVQLAMLGCVLLLAASQPPSAAAPCAPQPRVDVAGSSRAQALSPDGKELAFTVDDGTVGIVSLEGHGVRLWIDGFPTWMDSIAWSPDGKSLAVLAQDQAVRIIRASDGAVESQFKGSAPSKSTPWWSQSIEWVGGDAKLLLHGGSSPIQLRSRTGELIAKFVLDPEGVSSVAAIAPGGSRFAVGDTKGNVGLWSAGDAKPLADPLHVPKEVNALAFDAKGQRLAVGAGDCKVRIFTLGADAEPTLLSHCDEDIFGSLAIGGVDFSPDGAKLLSTSFAFHEVRLWNIESKSLIWKFDFGGGNPGCIGAHFTPDGSSVFTSRGGSLRAVGDMKTIRTLGEEALTPACNFRMERGRAWHQADGALIVFGVGDGKPLARIPLVRKR